MLYMQIYKVYQLTTANCTTYILYCLMYKHYATINTAKYIMLHYYYCNQ